MLKKSLLDRMFKNSKRQSGTRFRRLLIHYCNKKQEIFRLLPGIARVRCFSLLKICLGTRDRNWLKIELMCAMCGETFG